MIGGDAAVHSLLRGLLQTTTIVYIEATGADDGARAFYQEHPNVVVIDIDLSGREGWNALSTVRELSDTPVLILSSRDSEADKVQALRSGADDFICKPFGREEILARIEALLRRGAEVTEPPSVLVDDFLTVDRLQHRVQALGVEIDLTPTEFRMLCAFMSHPGRVLTHTQLLEIVWDHGYRDRDEVKLYVSYLRRKLREAALDPVETVRGVGYRYRPRRLAPAESRSL